MIPKSHPYTPIHVELHSWNSLIANHYYLVLYSITYIVVILSIKFCGQVHLVYFFVTSNIK